MKKLSLTIVSGLLLAGCSSQQFDSKNALEHWNNYHPDQNLTLKDNQALAIVYRTENFVGEPVNVYVNGDYQASLLEKGFTPVVVCADKQRFSASYTTNKKFGNRTEGVSYHLNKDESNFIKLEKDAQGNPIFVQVPAETAKAELNDLIGRVQHTLPRVVTQNDCEAMIEKRTLSASALWGLNKHSYSDMLAQGKKEIAEFAQFLKENEKVSRIEVRGYTDPEASVEYNLALSQKRANTVRQALLNAGVTQKIEAKGYGKTDLVVGHCAELHPHDAKAKAECNQPNRRVEINTYVK